MPQEKLSAIAAQIKAHLKRFEADPKINVRESKHRILPYYYPTAYDAGGWVFVVYVNFQGRSGLRRAAAEDYLAWLDAGNVGTHYKAGIR